MFLSKYNIYKKKQKNKEFESDVLIYNTFTGNIVLLTAEEYCFIKENNIQNVENSHKMSSLIKEMVLGGFIVKEESEQLNKLKFESYSTRYNKELLSLTIAPTTACNFKCPYCYEDGIEYETMNDEIVYRMIDFIESFKIKNVNICWYGGEPLLCIDKIKKTVDELQKKNFILEQSIVTNGYLLNKDNARVLKELGINQVQITLDGPPSIHDKRRVLKNGKPTFDTIINNVVNVCDHLNINIRVNVDSFNINFIDELKHILKQKNIDDKVYMYLAPVDNINSTMKKEYSSHLYESDNFEEFSKKQISFYEESISCNNDLSIFEERNPYLCGAVAPYSFLIAPSGDLYKCWNDIGRLEYRIGSISDGLCNEIELNKWLGYDPFNNEECINCNIFPICLSGCPHSIIRKNKNRCSSEKNNYEEYLSKII